jgi:hypothetical protein
MRQFLGAIATALGLGAAWAAAAAPAAEIRNAVARVVVSPEVRSDIKVEVIRANPRLPLRIWSFAGRTYIDGGLEHRIGGCRTRAGAPSVLIRGLGETPYDAMPQVIIHTPMDARVFAGGAIWGAVGRSDSLEFANAGCGAWQLANVRGRMKLTLAGSGDARTGQAGSAELYTAGAATISTRDVASGVTAVNLGSGGIDIASVNGPFTARIAGSGSVRAAAGNVSDMHAAIAGSGDITLDGVAGALKASIVGSGDVRVTRVIGPISRAVIGSGVVRVGS